MELPQEFTQTINELEDRGNIVQLERTLLSLEAEYDQTNVLSCNDYRKQLGDKILYVQSAIDYLVS